MNDQDFVTWLAGFIDGEGCFNFRDRGSSKGKEYRITITQSGDRGRKVLELIRDTVGSGSMFCDLKSNPNNYVWRLMIGKKADVKKVIEATLPYLKIKHVEATFLLNKVCE